jgi:cell division protein FtsW (lipid II flippase)
LIIDILIAATVVGAAIAGFQLGLLQPLLAELCFLGSLLILWAARGPYGRLIEAVFHGNALAAVFIALACAIVAGYAGGRLGGFVHRMPAVCGADGFLGLFVQPVVALLICYVLVAGLVAADRAMSPTEASKALTTAQVTAIERQLESNPLSAALAGQADWSRLEAMASRSGGAPISASPQLSRVRGFVRDFAQPQVSGSHLAPAVLAVGHAVGGSVGPDDLRPAGLSPPARSRSRTSA